MMNIWHFMRSGGHLNQKPSVTGVRDISWNNINTLNVLIMCWLLSWILFKHTHQRDHRKITFNILECQDWLGLQQYNNANLPRCLYNVIWSSGVQFRVYRRVISKSAECIVQGCIQNFEQLPWVPYNVYIVVIMQCSPNLNIEFFQCKITLLSAGANVTRCTCKSEHIRYNIQSQ